MRTPHPAFSTLSEMEDGVRNVARWGRVLRDLGSGSGSEVDAGACWVIGRALLELGEEIESRWEQAFRMAGGQS